MFLIRESNMKCLTYAVGITVLSVCSQAHGGGNWPQFRGPDGDGHSDSKGLPLKWSETENVKWKTAIHDRGWSSPVIWGNQIWLTTATKDARKLYALCLDRESGRIEKDLLLYEVESPQFIHEFNSAASPTPIIEEGRVYITFGSPGTACLDTGSGKVLWQRRDLVCNHFRGAGSSPIIYKNLLIMNFDGSDYQFVTALDKKTGKTVWETKRSVDYKDVLPNGKFEADGDWRKAFATPHVAAINGKDVLFSQGAKAAYAYQPENGSEIWRVEERTSHSAGTRPVIGNGMVFIPSGWSKGQLLAIKPDGKGDITESHVAWRNTKGIPKKPSLTLVGDLLFMVDDSGVAGCVEAVTGKEVWRERVGGNTSASPLYADGRLYFFNEEGKTSVVEAGREFKKLAENPLADGFMASPAVSGKALFLRTKTSLYRIEN
jgi:outer membrane protein assembly factor BamB